MEIVKRFGLFV